MTTAEKNTRFKVQGVGLDTTNIKDLLLKDDLSFDYIHTSISSNNDYLLKSFFKKSIDNPSLITTIDFFDNPEKALMGHLMELGKLDGIIDLLLVTKDAIIRNNGSAKDTVNGLKTSGIIKEFGISNPSTVEDIEDIEKLLGFDIKYISLDICPLNFNYEIISWCKNNGVDILGFNPFGGHISSSAMIYSFTVPYLLGFSSTYSSIVFLSGRDLGLSVESKDFIKSNIIGSDILDKFILKKSIFKLYKPITSKKVVKTSLILKEDLILDYDSPNLIFPLNEIIFNIGKLDNKSIVNLPEESLRTNIEERVYSLLNITEFPKDGNNFDKLAIARYQIMDILKMDFPRVQGWSTNIIQLCDKVFGICVTKEVTKKLKKMFLRNKVSEKINKYFILSITNDGEIVFMEENNSLV